VAGIPRILRPRKKYGTVSGFTVVDPGGNWLRIQRLNDSEDDPEVQKARGLMQIIDVAARLADAHGDLAQALKTLENGLARYPGAAPVKCAKAYLYRAELVLRTGDLELARASLAKARDVELNDEEEASMADEFAYVDALLLDEGT
jgi:hypothetical protein